VYCKLVVKIRLNSLDTVIHIRYFLLYARKSKWYMVKIMMSILLSVQK